jgi:hypothetical protein
MATPRPTVREPTAVQKRSDGQEMSANPGKSEGSVPDLQVAPPSSLTYDHPYIVLLPVTAAQFRGDAHDTPVIPGWLGVVVESSAVSHPFDVRRTPSPPATHSVELAQKTPFNEYTPRLRVVTDVQVSPPFSV